MVDCRICGTPTDNDGTRRCDRCWELERRIEADPDLAQQILAKLFPPAAPKTRDCDCPDDGCQSYGCAGCGVVRKDATACDECGGTEFTPFCIHE